MLRVLPTVFDGYRFRSRLEARWAAFFKAMKWTYQYEPEGFRINSYTYLPDFLVDGRFWVEVKPEIPDEAYLEILGESARLDGAISLKHMTGVTLVVS